MNSCYCWLREKLSLSWRLHRSVCIFLALLASYWRHVRKSKSRWRVSVEVKSPWPWPSTACKPKPPSKYSPNTIISESPCEEFHTCSKIIQSRDIPLGTASSACCFTRCSSVLVVAKACEGKWRETTSLLYCSPNMLQQYEIGPRFTCM